MRNLSERGMNIIFIENKAFGRPNYKIVRELLCMVDANMMEALGLPCFSTKKCVVVATDGDPMCVQECEQHLIYISAKDDYWCQWVYQFAHEYCHHIIDGSLSGEWSEILWFEETLCELSSLYNLNRMVEFCKVNGMQSYSSSVNDYLNGLLTENLDKYNICDGGGWYDQYEDMLKEKGYKRDLYNAIAVLMYPLFMKNPRLWKLILNIGDIRSWSSLDDLFEHLKANADESYVESLSQLRSLFSRKILVV